METQNPIHTQGDRNITYKVDNNDDCQGYYIKNDSQIGLVVISEWWGLNKSICTTADNLSKLLGCQVVVPDIYRGKVAVDREHAGHLMNGLDFSKAVNDIIGGIRYLRENGCKKVAVTGFCMGGALTLATASVSKELDMALPFYGIPDQSYFPVENISCPVYMQVGLNDDLKGFSDPEYCELIKSKAEKAGVKFELIKWEGAQHAFMNQDSERLNPEVAEKATNTLLSIIKA